MSGGQRQRKARFKKMLALKEAAIKSNFEVAREERDRVFGSPFDVTLSYQSRTTTWEPHPVTKAYLPVTSFKTVQVRHEREQPVNGGKMLIGITKDCEALFGTVKHNRYDGRSGARAKVSGFHAKQEKKSLAKPRWSEQPIDKVECIEYRQSPMKRFVKL